MRNISTKVMYILLPERSWRPGYNSVQNLLVLIRDHTSREHVYLTLPMTYNALAIDLLFWK